MVEDNISKDISRVVDVEIETGINLSLERFRKKLIEFGKSNRREQRQFLFYLKAYTGIISRKEGLRTAWEVIEGDIADQVEKAKDTDNHITAQKFIDNMFTPDEEGKMDAMVILARLTD